MPRGPANAWGRSIASLPRPLRSLRARLHARLFGLLAPCVLLPPARAVAELALPRAAAAPAGAEAAAPNTAAIVLVGALGEDEELRLLLRELLDRQGVTTELAHARSFETEALFTDGGGARGVRVFVALPDGSHARLYFRSVESDRYLLRRLTLPSGLDAVGRELLGQVVESSVAALLHSSEGLSREQATRELAREAEPPAATNLSPVARAPKRPAETPRPERGTERELHAGLRYAVSWSGDDLGLLHGPGAALGLRLRSRPSVGFELAAERYFTQTLSTDALAADIQKTSLLVLCEVGFARSGAHGLAIASGPSVELARTRPHTSAPDVTLAPASTAAAPALRAELRYSFTAGRVLVGAAALLDLGLVKTHYDLEDGAERRQLAAPSLVRPGAALSLGIR